MESIFWGSGMKMSCAAAPDIMQVTTTVAKTDRHIRASPSSQQLPIRSRKIGA
jgi:hypothetical protein